MNTLPICLVQYIFNMLDLKSQNNFILCSKRYRKKLFIKSLNTKKFISNETICLPVFQKLEHFNYKKGNITHLNHLKYLKTLKLKCCNITGLDYYCIVNMALYSLKIKNSNALCLHKLPFLQKLYLTNYNGSLSFLKHHNLRELGLYHIKGYTDIKINHMTNLRFLKLSGNIPQSELQNLKLVKLDLSFNSNLHSLSFLSTLQKLVLTSTSISCLKGLDLTSLNIRNSAVTDISFLTRLQSLSIFGKYIILENTIPTQSLQKLCLNCKGYNNILKKAPNLRALTLICDNNSIRNIDLIGLNLTYLNVSYNPYITEISHLTGLQNLKCQGNSAITSQSIKGLNIKKINYKRNRLF